MTAYDLETTIQLPDEEDVDVFIEFEVESWGSPGCGPSWNYPGDPPEPPEFGITKVERLNNRDNAPGEDITNLVHALPAEYLTPIYELVASRVYDLEESRGYEEDY